MPPTSLAPAPERLPLRRGRHPVALHETGVRLPRSRIVPGEVFVGYGELTHLELGARWVRIGSRRGVFWLRRADFADPSDPERLVRSLVARVAQEPDGTAQLARMAEVEEAVRLPRAPRAVPLLALACLGVWGLERALGPVVAHAGFFSASLAAHGEAWRAITANLLHGLPGAGSLGVAHLVLNLIGLLGVGALVELPLGAARTAFVLGCSALGAMGAGALAGYEYAVGASGIVSGLAGAALWLEFWAPERLPVAWRVPRRLFVGALLGNALLPLVVPVVAGSAHAGGFGAGLAAAALVTGPGLRRDALRPALVLANALLAILLVAALVGATPLVAGRPAAWARHAERLLSLPQTMPMVLNNAAWLMVTGASGPPSESLERALELAERAVSETRRGDPNLLDTLAEVQFQVGREEEAIATIDEAIALAPNEAYFREQRRRFTGERAPDDRPEPPREPPPTEPGPPLPEFPEPGVRV